MTTDNRSNVQIVADALRSMPEAERDDDRDPAVVVAEYAVAALASADAVVTVEMIAEVILKSLVFTDATSMAWANGVARNVLALIRGGGEQ